MKQGIDYIGVSVGALILNNKHELLLLKRSMQARNEKGKWEAPGGGVHFGETLEEAIKREMMEEIGVDILLLKQFPAQSELLAQEKQHWVATTFVAKIKGRQKPRLMEAGKHDAIGWFALNNLPKPLSWITQTDITQYGAQQKKLS